MFGIQFYPTPKHLRDRMIAKLGARLAKVRTVLDPSAGKGDLLEPFLSGGEYCKHHRNGSRFNVLAVEIDRDLQSVLREKGARVIDTDWLRFSGMDQPDCILMNPPFQGGERHLLKALDVMHSGDIVCLLNAETLRNPYSKERKLLVRKLSDLGADIEYIEGGFEQAERKTSVEVALIHVIKNEQAKEEGDSLTDGLQRARDEVVDEDDLMSGEVVHRDSIEALVLAYEGMRDNAIQLLLSFHNSKLPDFIGLSIDRKHYHGADEIKSSINLVLKKLRRDFWEQAVMQDSVRRYMTSDGVERFYKEIESISDMDFTVENIKWFINNLRGSFALVMASTIEKIFDMMTRQHAWYPESKRNIHYFNGWATNNAFKVNKKVIIPVNFYCDIWDKFKVDYSNEQKLNDIEKTIAYFCDDPVETTLVDAISSAFATGQTRKIESSLFIASVYKKGTLHLEFKDEKAVQRFNFFVCAHKGWLPRDYGRKPYNTMTPEEKSVADSYEGKTEYERNHASGLYKKDVLVNRPTALGIEFKQAS